MGEDATSFVQTTTTLDRSAGSIDNVPSSRLRYRLRLLTGVCDGELGLFLSRRSQNNTKLRACASPPGDGNERYDSAVVLRRNTTPRALTRQTMAVLSKKTRRRRFRRTMRAEALTSLSPASHRQS